ncbi:MAG: FAD-binding oxidoreductase [Candidatus Helarchaeota archaeon]|nr:FAD-binding oxidoreductase [Candidatus Helarchaeota archaeon]
MVEESQIKNNEFEALLSVVGPQNVSKEPAILDTYAFQWCAEIINVMNDKPPARYFIRPAAVIMPGSTSEVQQIVRICNKYGLKFKAFSTGLGPWNCVSNPRAIQVDMRRMNKIVKIDVKNQFAVVEPYVSGAQLQAETMKFGLNCHMPGAGPQVSPLASATSMGGPGFTSASTGFAGRNVLGVEWVLPSGDLLQLGALGMKNEPDWFTGDGPGPSLRGIMRGFMGTKSGLGIFTKVATKLYPFPCQTGWKVTGESPDYNFEIPNYLQFWVINYKDWEGLENALRRFEEEELGFMCYYASTAAVVASFSKAREELASNYAIHTRLKRPLTIMVAAVTEREFNFKKRTVEALIEETGGKDYTPRLKIRSVSYAEALRCLLGFHGFLITGAFQSTHGGMDTISMAMNLARANVPLKRKYIEQKVIADDGGEGVWLASYERGHMAHCEMPTMYDPTDPKSVIGMTEYAHACDEMDIREHLGAPFFVESDKQHAMFGPFVMNYDRWLRKIKETFDPNNIADPGFYISSKKEAK